MIHMFLQYSIRTNIILDVIVKEIHHKRRKLNSNSFFQYANFADQNLRSIDFGFAH